MKIYRSVIKLILTVILTFSATKILAEDVVMHINDATAYAGEEFTVTATMEAESAALGSIVLAYDPTVVEYVSHSFSESLMSANAMFNPEYKGNMMKINWISMEGSIDFTDFISITFKGKSASESVIEVAEISIYTLEEEKLSAVCDGAKVTIKRKSSGGGSLSGGRNVSSVNREKEENAESGKVNSGDSAESNGITVNFSDLDGTEWAREAVTELASKGIISGVSENEFAPGSMIKRADFLCLLVRMLEKEEKVTENFDDVSEDKYYYREIGIARKMGLTSGVGENMFLPEKSITRQEMFTMVYNIMNKLNGSESIGDEDVLKSFTDRDTVADYAVKAIASLVEKGIVSGTDSKLLPENNATRAEAAVLIYRMYSNQGM